MTLEVAYAPVAAAQLAEMKQGRFAKQSAYQAVAALIRDVIGDERLAFARSNMLRDELANVLRVKKGRLRIFYLASSVKRRAIVLMIGFRKEGDKHDAYEDLRREIRRGTFDPQFAELGVAKPAL